MKAHPIRRTKNLCEGCNAECCKSLVLPLTKPRTNDEIDELAWQVQYENVGVYIHNKRWHLIFNTRCMYLSKSNLCTIYDKRPSKCRQHNPPYCERYDKWHDVFISAPEELRGYLNREKQAKKHKKKQKKK